jgi:hypothetical protein
VPNLDSSRYTIRPGNSTKQARPDVNKVEIPKLESVKAESVKVESKPPQPSPQSVPANIEKSADADVAADATEDVDSLEKLKEALHPEDPRRNIVNIYVAPSYMYVNSSSDYWYRNYHSSGPSIFAGADIWYTPNAGLILDYTTSLSAELDVSSTSSETSIVDHRYSNLGFQFRKFASLSRRASSVYFNVKYSEYQMIIPKAETERTRLKTNGVSVGVRANLPKTHTMSWFYGADFLPKLKVKEESTALTLKSGTDDVTYGMRLFFGQEFLVDHSHRMYWRLSHRVDKSVYEGAANQNDPITGAAPTGVTVTNGTSLFEVGYTWGN